MHNRSSEELFALVKGMTRSEKKSFHLYARRNMNTEDLKVLALYNAINDMERYDEKLLAKKLRTLQVKQLPSLKVNLYTILLDSLRIISRNSNLDIQLHQLIDHAKILYNKGFHIPSLKVLRRVKTLALRYHQISFAYQVVVMEKNIELFYGTDQEDRVAELNRELQAYSEQLSAIADLSNLATELYALCKKFGRAGNAEQERIVASIFNRCQNYKDQAGFYPELYKVQARAYYNQLLGNDQAFYKATHEWVCLFASYPQMKEAERLQYERGLAYFSQAAVELSNQQSLVIAVEGLADAADLFYKQMARLNLYLYNRDADQNLLSEIYSLLEKKPVNEERIIVLFHKAAMLCMKAGLYKRAIDFTHSAICIKSGLRLDLQYRLRLLHIEAHEKLENVEILDYLSIAARRFYRSKLMTFQESQSFPQRPSFNSSLNVQTTFP